MCDPAASPEELQAQIRLLEKVSARWVGQAGRSRRRHPAVAAAAAVAPPLEWLVPSAAAPATQSPPFSLQRLERAACQLERHKASAEATDQLQDSQIQALNAGRGARPAGRDAHTAAGAIRRRWWG